MKIFKRLYGNKDPVARVILLWARPINLRPPNSHVEWKAPAADFPSILATTPPQQQQQQQQHCVLFLFVLFGRLSSGFPSLSYRAQR